MRQIILDTETTGLEWKKGNRIVEIGCVELFKRRPTGNNYHQYIKPDCEFEQGAQEVTGLTLEFLADKPDFAQIADEFLAFIDGAELIIHNAAFDLGFLDNELSQIAERLHIDVWEVIRLANRHPRVSILSPGPGVGGHCIPVDPWFIVSAAPDLSPLIRMAREVNDRRPHHVAEQVVAKAGRFRAPTIACLGLTFKADVDDIRESPAVEVVGLIAKALPDIEVLVCDPYVHALPPLLAGFPNLRLMGSYDAVDLADIVVLLVEHEPFRPLRNTRLSGKVVYDTRGVWR